MVVRVLAAHGAALQSSAWTSKRRESDSCRFFDRDCSSHRPFGSSKRPVPGQGTFPAHRAKLRELHTRPTIAAKSVALRYRVKARPRRHVERRHVNGDRERTRNLQRQQVRAATRERGPCNRAGAAIAPVTPPVLSTARVHGVDAGPTVTGVPPLRASKRAQGRNRSGVYEGVPKYRPDR